MATNIDNGSQELTFDYKQEATAISFNRILNKLLPAGIYGTMPTLTKVSNTAVDLSPFTALLNDTSKNLSIKARLNSTATVLVSNTTPLVVMRYEWLDTIENYAELLSIAEIDLQDDDIIIGKCNYSGTVLVDFDYTLQSDMNVSTKKEILTSILTKSLTVDGDIAQTTGTSTLKSTTVDGLLKAGSNTDTIHEIARTKIFGISDVAYFSHYDMANDNDYAVSQTADGLLTTLNAKTGGTGALRVNNANVVTYTDSAISLLKDTSVTGALTTAELLTVSASGITSSSASVDILKPVNVAGMVGDIKSRIEENTENHESLEEKTLLEETITSSSLTGLGQITRQWSGITTSGNDVYACVINGDIYKQTNGTGDFLPLGQTPRPWRGMSTSGNDVYAIVYNGDIYKQTNGTGDFLPLGQTSRSWSGITTLGTDVYVSDGGGDGDIYKQTNGTGDFLPLGQTPRPWGGMSTSGNDVYAIASGDIYKQTNGTGNFIALGQTSRFWEGMTTLGTDLYANVQNGDTYKQTNGTGDFLPLGQGSRFWSDMTTLGTDVYASVINGDIYKATTWAIFDTPLRTYNLNGTAPRSIFPTADIGEPKTFRKISSDTNVITITLSTGHTFSGGGQSITLTNQYEEVTIERVSGTVWVEKDRVEVLQITSFLNGWAPITSEWNVFVYKQDKTVTIRGLIVGGSQGTIAFYLPEKFKPSRKQILSVGGGQNSPDTYYGGILLVETDGRLNPFYTNPSLNNTFISLSTTFRLD